MQEERSSIENTADQSVKSSENKEVKAKKASKKKEPKIPTVNAIVEKVEAEENKSETETNVKSEAEKKSEKTEIPAEQKKETSSEKTEPAAEQKNDVSVKEEVLAEQKDESSSEKTEPSVKEENSSEQTETSSEKTETTSEQNETAYSEESEYPEEESEEDSIAQKRKALNLDSETALVEAVLFLESEPQNTASLAKITQLSEDVVAEALARLRERYADADSGIEIAEIIGGWMLVPKKESFEFVKERYGKKNEGRLSKAAIETLSIIAYSQPITRAEIESIRHVNADNMMRVLLDRHFIKEVGKKDIPGKPILYGTTKEFLEFFHLQSISDLPQLDEKESERFELAR